MGDDKIEISETERKLLRRVLADFLADMRERRGNPRGWTHGDVQDGLNAAQSILTKIG